MRCLVNRTAFLPTAAPGKARRPTHRTGRLAGLLVRQLFPGHIRLAAPLLHPKPCLAQRLWFRGAGRPTGTTIRVVPIVTELVGGAGLLTLLTERLLLWDTLSRSGLPSALLPVLGAVLHRNIGSRSAAPIRNRGLRRGSRFNRPGGLQRIPRWRNNGLRLIGSQSPVCRLRLGLFPHAGRRLFPRRAAPFGFGLCFALCLRAQDGTGLVLPGAAPLTLRRHSSNPPDEW